MRKKHKDIEAFFAGKFVEYYKKHFDNEAVVLNGIVDRPDLGIKTKGKRIGVELSQVPSRYIVKSFHKKFPLPAVSKNSAAGELFVYPFEPHRWVHEVLEKKYKSAEACKKRIGADEIWLVLHGHSQKRDWPMSKFTSEKSRLAEWGLMRFGTKRFGSHYDRIYFTYADGSVVFLRKKSDAAPKKVSLAEDVGYPAVTEHRISFNVEVPLPGLGHRKFEFRNIDFTEHLVPPIDDWMLGREPNIQRPKIDFELKVDSERASIIVYRDGTPKSIEMPMDKLSGQVASTYFLLEWGLLPTRFNFTEG